MRYLHYLLHKFKESAKNILFQNVIYVNFIINEKCVNFIEQNSHIIFTQKLHYLKTWFYSQIGKKKHIWSNNLEWI